MDCDPCKLVNIFRFCVTRIRWLGHLDHRCIGWKLCIFTRLHAVHKRKVGIFAFIAGLPFFIIIVTKSTFLPFLYLYWGQSLNWKESFFLGLRQSNNTFIRSRHKALLWHNVATFSSCILAILKVKVRLEGLSMRTIKWISSHNLLKKQLSLYNLANPLI